MKKYIPWILTAVMAAWVAGSLFQKPETGVQTREFGKLPILLNGRIQPMDSMARNCLLQIRNRQTVAWSDAQGSHKLNATAWLMDVMMKSETADAQPLFRIDNPELLDLLNLPRTEQYCSFNDIKGQLGEIDRQADRISGIDGAERTPFEKQVMKLQNALVIYQRLQLTLRPSGSDDFAAELAAFQSQKPAVAAALNAQQAGQPYDEKLLKGFADALSAFGRVGRYAYARVVPPVHPEVARDAWENVGTNVLETTSGQSLSPAVQAYAAMVTAFRQNNPGAFNNALHGYTQWLGEKFAPEVAKGQREFFYNGFEAFYKALVIYVLVFVLACVSWFNRAEIPRRSAYYLMFLALAVHTFGMGFRMMLEGRPPVTNLYSSAVFIGWAAALLGLVLERLYRDGLGLAIGSLVGFVTLVIAHNLAGVGDTMEMMRAVLDSNFWLSTHVVTVTLGYAATFVAGLLAIFYLIRGFFTSTLDSTTGKSLARMVYGIVCFATLFSFVGTVLGGIWADQSWGRFWGWDPKENGALIIVLWNAAILHARWGGMVRERGLMNMAIFGNIVTSFSWFGVNMLGVGLHSYGFMDAAFKWLMVFVVSQVALIGLGLLPLRYWRSFRVRVSPSSAPAGPTGGKTSPAPAGA